MRRSNLLSLWLTLLLVVTSSAPAALAQQQAARAAVAPLPKAEVKAADKITAAALSERLHYVASDEMQGRDTPSPGLDATAKYIAANLKRAVEHHVKEEEGEMFPKAKDVLSPQQLDELGTRMEQEKQRQQPQKTAAAR